MYLESYWTRFLWCLCSLIFQCFFRLFRLFFFFFSWEYSTGKITIMTFTLKKQDESDWNWWLISGLQDFTQIYQAAFKLPWNLWAWTKLHTRMVKKAAERTLIKFFFLALCQSNASFFFSYTVSNGIKPLWDETTFPDLIILCKC